MNKKDKKQTQNNSLFVPLTEKEQQQLSGGQNRCPLPPQYCNG